MIRPFRTRMLSEKSQFSLRDLGSEVIAGVLQRPTRSLLTVVGTVLGTAAFVSVLGLTATANGQISKQFTVLDATTVTVTDVGSDSTSLARIDFPADADGRVGTLNGVIADGVYWQVPLRVPVISTSPDVSVNSPSAVNGLPVYAVSAGALAAMQPTLQQGMLYNAFHDRTGQDVAVLGPAAASRLGIAQLTAQPAVFINGTAFTVVGIISGTQRLPDTLLGILIPRTTAQRLYGPPDPTTSPAQMVIRTRLGAAQVVAHETPLALRPDNPSLFRAVPPPDPESLHNHVTSTLTGLFLGLAAVCLVVGAVGIANTTLVAVLERFGEIGLRRALGARARHIAAQFLAESAALGLLGGLVGTALGVSVVLGTAIAHRWTAVLEPAAVFPAPFIGAATGLIAGLYPALRASSTEPQAALRR